MRLFDLFLYLAIVFAVINIATTIRIVHELTKRDVKINFFLLRLYILKYVNQYRKITLQETGRIGAMYYFWIISINLVLLSAFAALIAR